MKNLMTTILFLMATTAIYAQKSESARSSKEQVISKEDPHNPLVNGIPYDQYKAQTIALDKARIAANVEAIEKEKAEQDRIKNLGKKANENVLNAQTKSEDTRTGSIQEDAKDMKLKK